MTVHEMSRQQELRLQQVFEKRLADVTATGGDLPLVYPEDFDNQAATLTFVGNAGEQHW